MHHQQGILCACVPPPVTLCGYTHSGLSFKHEGFDRKLPQVDAGGPEARHNSLPVTALKKRLERVGGVQSVQGFVTRNNLRWHSVASVKKLKSKLSCSPIPATRALKKTQERPSFGCIMKPRSVRFGKAQIPQNRTPKTDRPTWRRIWTASSACLRTRPNRPSVAPSWC